MYVQSSIFLEIILVCRWVIGRDECAPSLTIEQRPKPEAKGAIVNFLEKYREQFRHWHLIRNRNHPTCKHRYHCLVHILLVRSIVFQDKEISMSILGFFQTIFCRCRYSNGLTSNQITSSFSPTSSLLPLHIE